MMMLDIQHTFCIWCPAHGYETARGALWVSRKRCRSLPKKEFRFFFLYLRAHTYTTNGEKQNKKRAMQKEGILTSALTSVLT